MSRTLMLLNKFLFQTVFELNPQQKSVQYEIMKNKRAAHGEIIKMFQKKVAEIEQETENNFLDNVNIKSYNLLGWSRGWWCVFTKVVLGITYIQDFEILRR